MLGEMKELKEKELFARQQWDSQKDQIKSIMLNSLAENEWDFEKFYNDYGKIYQILGQEFFKTEYIKVKLTPTRTSAKKEKLKATPLKNTLKKVERIVLCK